MNITLETLNYATRQIASELDPALLTQRTLDTLSDFSKSRNLALLTYNDGRKELYLTGTLKNGEFTQPGTMVQFKGTPVQNMLALKQVTQFPLDLKKSFAFPGPIQSDSSEQCLCMPLIGTENQFIGLIVMEIAQPINPENMQVLRVLSTLVATTMENARLFRLATVDGLTGLYVRRYFDIRLKEEVARIKRHGGVVSILITDIDHFKLVNDRYGHQQGDMVLRELAQLFQQLVRQDIDIVCRYGGEEFVIIMPGTGSEGAALLGERLRNTCQNYPFSGQDIPLSVTISGGIASMTGEDDFTVRNFIKTADDNLYQAKAGGRNNICV